MRTADEEDLRFAKSMVLAAEHTLRTAPTRIAQLEEQINQLRKDQETLRRQFEEAPAMRLKGQKMAKALLDAQKEVTSGPATHVERLRARHDRLTAKLGRLAKELPGDS